MKKDGSIEFRCFICHGDRFSLLWHKRKLAGAEKNLHYYICEGCGLVFRYPQPDTKKLEEFYELEYWVYPTKVFTKSNSNARLVHWLKTETGLYDEGTLIDIGCGSGDFVYTLAEAYPKCSIIGIEPHAGIASRLREQLPSLNVRNLKVRQGSLRSIQNMRDVRVASMISVFEHLENPPEALDLLHKVIASDGWLLLKIPNVMEPGRFGLDYFFREPHLFYYSVDTISALLAKHSFETARIAKSDEFQSVSGPQLVLIAKRVQKTVISPPLLGQYEKIKKRIDGINRFSWLIGPVRIFWHRRIRSSLLTTGSKIKQFLLRLTGNGNP